jgi:hypothetical protein
METATAGEGVVLENVQNLLERGSLRMLLGVGVALVGPPVI